MSSARREHLHTLSRMWRHPRSGRDELLAFQAQKLQAIVRHASTAVPYYRELFARAGLSPDDLAGPADLPRLPPTSKDDVRARALTDRLAAGSDVRSLVQRTTSGSSGKPFTILRSPGEDHLLNLFRIRTCRGLGMRISDRVARVRETPLGRGTPALAGHLRRALGIHPTFEVNALEPAAAIARNLRRLKPDVVMGYASTLAHVASHAPGTVAPHLVFTGGEVLTTSMRRAVEDGFGARLFDLYGAHEVNLIASECPAGHGYHVCDDNVIVEVLGQQTPGDGAAGEVIVTALHAYTMPFIRYRTGDVASLGPAPCACGQPFSTLRDIRGRAVEYFHLAGGLAVHPFEITGPLIEHHREWVFQHQLVRESETAVTLRILPRRPPDPAAMSALEESGRHVLGPKVRFSVQLVDAFTSRPGSKFSPYLVVDGDAATVPAPEPTAGVRARAVEAGPPVTSPTPTAWAECSRAPEAVIVHDPVAAGALDRLAAFEDESGLVETFLFRAKPARDTYWQQHRAFVELLRRHVKRVMHLSELVGDHPAFTAAHQNPNQVFTRDSLITLPWEPRGYIPSRMAKPLRRPETDAMEAAMASLGLSVLFRLPEHLYLEGGDVVPFSLEGRRTLLVGYGPRTRLETLHHLHERMIPAWADEIVGIELASWRLNLDGGFLPVAEDVVLADTGSLLRAIRFDASGQRPLDLFTWLREHGIGVIEVSREESIDRQACNCLCLGGRRVICYDLSDRVFAALRRRDIEVFRTPGSELVKGRGGPRCMTRPLYWSRDTC